MSQVDYFRAKSEEFDRVQRTVVDVGGVNDWSRYPDEWYCTPSQLHHLIIEQFLDWLKDNE